MPGKRTAGRKWHLFLIAAGALAWGSGGSARAASYYVAPSGKEGSAGTRAAPWSLKKANASARPGDTVVLLDGVYTGAPIRPARSGEAGKEIVYRAAHPQKAEIAKVHNVDGADPRMDDNSDQPAAIILMDRHYVTLNGLRVIAKGGRWIYADGASHITVEDCHFENGVGGWEGCMFKRVGERIIFRNNVVKKGNDSVAITGGSHHLIEGNTFDTAQHTLLVLMGVQRSVVRKNRFVNPNQKLMEVFSGRNRDFGKRRAKGVRKSEYLVIEDNFFGPAPRIEKNGTDSGSGSAGIQYAGNRSILRRNVFYQCGMGMDFTRYGAGAPAKPYDPKKPYSRKNYPKGKHPDDPEALYCEKNRFYNNTIYDCGWPARYGSGPGIHIASGPANFGDQVIMNNILYRNHAHADAHFPKRTPHDVQLAYGKAEAFRLYYNNLMGRKKGGVVLWKKAGWKKSLGYTLKDFEKKFAEFAHGNIAVEPMFVGAEKGDFHLKAGSPCMDAGGALTITTGGGTGKVVPIADALFFSDGHGVTEPDVIRIGRVRVKVSKVDYMGRRITVERKISWTKGAWVRLDFSGKAPDMGAFEHGSSAGGP